MDIEEKTKKSRQYQIRNSLAKHVVHNMRDNRNISNIVVVAGVWLSYALFKKKYNDGVIKLFEYKSIYA